MSETGSFLVNERIKRFDWTGRAISVVARVHRTLKKHVNYHGNMAGCAIEQGSDFAACSRQNPD